MLTPFDIAKLGIRNFIRWIGWNKVAEIVREEFPNNEQLKKLAEKHPPDRSWYDEPEDDPR